MEGRGRDPSAAGKGAGPSAAARADAPLLQSCMPCRAVQALSCCVKWRSRALPSSPAPRPAPLALLHMQVVLLGWCSSQRDMEVVRKVLQQVSAGSDGSRGKGSSWRAGGHPSSQAAAHGRLCIAIALPAHTRAGPCPTHPQRVHKLCTHPWGHVDAAQMCRAYKAEGGRTLVVMTQRSKLEMEAAFWRWLPEARRHGSTLVFRCAPQGWVGGGAHVERTRGAHRPRVGGCVSYEGAARSSQEPAGAFSSSAPVPRHLPPVPSLPHLNTAGRAARWCRPTCARWRPRMPRWLSS